MQKNMHFAQTQLLKDILWYKYVNHFQNSTKNTNMYQMNWIFYKPTYGISIIILPIKENPISTIVTKKYTSNLRRSKIWCQAKTKKMFEKFQG